MTIVLLSKHKQRVNSPQSDYAKDKADIFISLKPKEICWIRHRCTQSLTRVHTLPHAQTHTHTLTRTSRKVEKSVPKYNTFSYLISLCIITVTITKLFSTFSSFTVLKAPVMNPRNKAVHSFRLALDDACCWGALLWSLWNCFCCQGTCSCRFDCGGCYLDCGGGCRFSRYLLSTVNRITSRISWEDAYVSTIIVLFLRSTAKTVPARTWIPVCTIPCTETCVFFPLKWLLLNLKILQTLNANPPPSPTRSNLGAYSG